MESRCNSFRFSRLFVKKEKDFLYPAGEWYTDGTFAQLDKEFGGGSIRIPGDAPPFAAETSTAPGI